MVYEDALHILSYASPYPVSLRIMKPSSGASPGVGRGKSDMSLNESTDEKPLLLHPLYRSQSAADINNIGSGQLLGEDPALMRRARSEMKRGSSKTAADSSTRSSVSNAPKENGANLKKWDNLHGDVAIGGDVIVAETTVAVESSPHTLSSSEDTLDAAQKDDNDFALPDFHLNTSDLMGDFPDNSSNTDQVVVDSSTVMGEIHPNRKSMEIRDDTSSSSGDDSDEHVVSATIETKPAFITFDMDTTESSTDAPELPSEAPPGLPLAAPPTEEPPMLPSDEPPMLPSMDPPSIPASSPPYTPHTEKEQNSDDDNDKSFLLKYGTTDMSLDSDTMFENIAPTITLNSDSNSEDENKVDIPEDIDIEGLKMRTLELESTHEVIMDEDKEVEGEDKEVEGEDKEVEGEDLVVREDIVPVKVERKAFDFSGEHDIEFHDVDRQDDGLTDAEFTALSGPEIIILQKGHKRSGSNSSASSSDFEQNPRVFEVEHEKVTVVRRRISSSSGEETEVTEETVQKSVVHRGHKRKSTVSSSSSSSSDSSDDGEVDVLIPPEMQEQTETVVQTVQEEFTQDSEKEEPSTDVQTEKLEQPGTPESDTDMKDFDFQKLQKMLLEKSSANSSRRNSGSSVASSAAASTASVASSKSSAPSEHSSSLEEAHEGEPGENQEHIEEEDDMRDVLKYLADQPSLMEKLGLSSRAENPEAEEIGEGEADEASDEEDNHVEPETIEPVDDTEFLKSTKEAIRRHSRTSSSSSSSSCSSSPSSAHSSPDEQINQITTEQHHQTQSPFIKVGIPLVDPNTPQIPPNKANGSGDRPEVNGISLSGSPDIQRRSGGGLSYDITNTDLNNMDTVIKTETTMVSSEHHGGEQYYYSLNEDLSPPAFIANDDGRPELIPVGEQNHHGITTTRVTHITTTTTNVDGDVETTRTVTEDNTVRDLNDNKLDMDGALLFKQKDRNNITLTPHENVEGSYVLSVETPDDTDA